MDLRAVNASMRRLNLSSVCLVIAGGCLSLLGGCAGPADTGPAAPAAPPAVAYEAHVTAGGNIPAGGKLVNPHAGDAAVAKNGQQLFSTMNCDGCHGSEGSGWVGPSLQDGRWHYGGDDGEVFSSIFYGRPRGMPAFGGTLGTEGVWALVTYLKSLPVPKDIATESWETGDK
jgi:cytochrome c oxidase cbb3-type subunit 3